MTIHVRLFAVLRERAGLSEVTLELPDGATAARAAERLVERLPALGGHAARAAFAVNRVYVRPDEVLNDGDELALIPPVSGG